MHNWTTISHLLILNMINLRLYIIAILSLTLECWVVAMTAQKGSLSMIGIKKKKKRKKILWKGYQKKRKSSSIVPPTLADNWSFVSQACRYYFLSTQGCLLLLTEWLVSGSYIDGLASGGDVDCGGGGSSLECTVFGPFKRVLWAVVIIGQFNPDHQASHLCCCCCCFCWWRWNRSCMWREIVPPISSFNLTSWFQEDAIRWWWGGTDKWKTHFLKIIMAPW